VSVPLNVEQDPMKAVHGPTNGPAIISAKIFRDAGNICHETCVCVRVKVVLFVSVFV